MMVLDSSVASSALGDDFTFNDDDTVPTDLNCLIFGNGLLRMAPHPVTWTANDRHQ